MVGGEFGENFAVKCETVFLQFRDEGGVRLVAIVANRGVQANDPELAEVGFLILTVSE